ncbi:MAG TPA: barstar family protein [Baekduia sp.]|nr:barstar family protein [Baekduia sp.]
MTEVQREARLKLWTTEAAAAAEAAADWLEAGLTVRTVRGAKMRSTAALMDEVASALQFPHYFGENWAALDECLADMEWLLPSTGIVLLVRDAELVLVDEGGEALEAFVAALRNASDEYGEPVELGEAWDRPAVPFHVVLQASGDASSEAAARWTAAGARLSD